MTVHALLAPVVLALLALAGCGGSSRPTCPTVQPARVYALADFQPSAPVQPGKPTAVSFVIQQPDGTPLTKFKTRTGPAHRRAPDLRPRRPRLHRPPAPAGRARTGRSARRSRFPRPVRTGSWSTSTRRAGPQPNFQLFGKVRVAGAYHAAAAAADGGRGDRRRLPLHAHRRYQAERDRGAATSTVDVTDPHGKPATFTPWFGALAHAIFFRRGSLDYFHTHVCAPGASGCTSMLGATKVVGTSTTPGKLTVGVLVPAPGTWRLFLQCRVDGRILTAPFTLHVTMKGATMKLRPTPAARTRRSARARRRGDRVGARARSARPSRSSKELQLYSLAVPTEKEGATTTKIVLTVPTGFSIDSFVAEPRLDARAPADRLRRGRGDPEGDVDAAAARRRGRTRCSSSSAQPSKSGTYTFQVEQTYSDGSIVNWTGPESSEDPAPTIEAKSSLGGGGTLDRSRSSRSSLGAVGVARSAASRSSRGADGGRRELGRERRMRARALVRRGAARRRGARARCRRPRRRTPTW